MVRVAVGVGSSCLKWRTNVFVLMIFTSVSSTVIDTNGADTGPTPIVMSSIMNSEAACECEDPFKLDYCSSGRVKVC